MGTLDKLKKEFGFIQGNYLILILSWILMDFAGELAAPYYPEYVRQLGATESIVGIIGFVALRARTREKRRINLRNVEKLSERI